MSALEKLKNKNTPPTELELCILMAGSLESPEKAAEQLEYLVEQNKMFLDAMNTLRDKLDNSEDELAALRERVAASEKIMQDTKKYLDAVIQSQGGVGMEYELGIVEDIQIYFDKLQESK